MDEYKKYLAERLFTEDKMVTYRTLSRALKVHVNSAKAMLYDFHSWQNSIEAGKVHATYIILGTRKPTAQSDGDVEMASSAPEGDYYDSEVATQSLTLVTEERLKDVLAEYSSVTSFAVYSLAAHPVKELQLLKDVSREALQVGEDNYAEDAKTYGTISNPGMKKRTRKGKRPSPAPAPAPAEKKPALEKQASAVKEEPATKSKAEPKPAASASSATPAASAAPAASAKKVAPAPKKNSIAMAFSKTKPKKATSAASTPKTDTQSPALSDDGEDDEAPVPAPLPKRAEDGTARRSRQDREAELRRMMEEESEEEEDEPEEKEDEDEPMEEAPEPEAEAELESQADQEPAEVVASSGTGRRRGKRRVMKKRQAMDKDGFLVTSQEMVWESFSEDEAPAPAAPAASAKTKSTAASTPASGASQGTKGKKAAPKVQGNIMSFFSKK
ncbi:DNA polymerase subunit Cdc27 [Plectosphaerella cucumerina]|uniref:DNA polymerase delta subunit 3 n=1 Tax=Plectosphaerella cucumerina TaxID=40658 RepID=A0A8K0TUT5_9PEZI|nr:DNA polymerase subunit Cdc27 [Plectosphaerella cucumerina]